MVDPRRRANGDGVATRECELDDDERLGIDTFDDGLAGGGSVTDCTEDITSIQEKRNSCKGIPQERKIHTS